MTRRALLIGSQTYGLTGVEIDVARLSEALETVGFDIRTCTSSGASRAGIFEQYERLIADTSAADAALVYYSGHGGRVVNSAFEPLNAGGSVAPRAFQFIVPIDLDQSTDDDFRGILDVELSALLAALTDKTRNVTVILDCCHAARMSRDAEMTPRALPRPWLVGVSAHLEALRARGLPVDRLAPEGNPDAVRLVACGPTESAFEYRTPGGAQMGLLTESFVIALEESRGLTVSWTSLAQRIQKRVVNVAPTQRPEVEGPTNRVLFDLERIEETGILPVVIRDGVPILAGGRLLGLAVGDEYGIVAPRANGPNAAGFLAKAIVTRVHGAQAEVSLEYVRPYDRLLDGCRAIPLRKATRRCLVRVVGDGTPRVAVAEAINASARARVADEKVEDSADIFAEVTVTDRTLAIRDRAGNPLTYDLPADDQAIRGVIESLTTFARAQALCELSGGTGPNRLDVPYTLEWGRIDNGRPRPLARSGELLFPGEAVYVRLANHGRVNLYFSVFDVGLSGRIGLMTTSEPSGIEVQPGSEYVVGVDRSSGRLVGLSLSWPPAVPPQGQHVEMLTTIVADRPQDLRALEQPGLRSAAVQSELQRLRAQIGGGGMRDLASETSVETDVRYAVDHTAFLVTPGNAPPREAATFLIDDRPDLSLLFRTSRSVPSTITAAAIRLTDLIVHRNRALFGAQFGGDVRIDAVVVTGPTPGAGQPAYRLETARFPRVRDGDRLPFDNLLVFHGPVAGFIDIGVWVSRDQKDSPGLADLFQHELNSDEFKGAAAVLAGLAVTAPQAAVVVGALGAGATICSIAARLLSTALGHSIGLYRTSLLAQEGFGVGRHPASGCMRAQDFSLGFEVLAVG